MSQLDMAMAVNGNINHSVISSGAQAPENCWSTTAWEHQNPTNSGSMENSGGGDYSSNRLEWDLKANTWEWENITMVYPHGRQADGNQRLQNNEWANGASSVVTLASLGGASKNGVSSIGLASGNSMPSGTSVSSGIPGLAASRGNGSDELSSLVKTEAEEHAIEPPMVDPPVSAMDEQHRLFICLGGGETRNSEEETPGRVDTETKPSKEQSNCGNNVITVGGQGDLLNIGLKLGRKTYFEDSSGAVQSKAPAPAFSPPGKKHRPMSPNLQIPRCQVEGCKADLSSVKEYHRRHKVCEMHSKAPKAIAAGIEQRFCQQCSRFHVLTEFDEGKRSCRRRLAGHNERRRKPHPDTLSTHGLRSLSPLHRDTSAFTMDVGRRSSLLQQHTGSSFEDDEYPYGNQLRFTNPWSLTRRNENGLACQLQVASAERHSIFSTLSRPTTDRLLMLLQSPKTQMAAPNPSTGLAMGGHQFLDGPMGQLGQGLSLSSSTGGILGSLEHSQIGACSQSLTSASGLTDSGRALSLLSSQSWVSGQPPGTPAPVPFELPQAANTTLEQLVAGSSDTSTRGSPFSHHLQLPSGGSPTSEQTHHHEKLFPVQSENLNPLGVDCGLRGAGNGTNQHQSSVNSDYLAGLEGFDGPNSVLARWQAGQDFQGLERGSLTSHHSRPTINLMQMPSVPLCHQGPHNNGSHSQQSNGQYSGFNSLRPSESSMFSTQQML